MGEVQLFYEMSLRYIFCCSEAVSFFLNVNIFNNNVIFGLKCTGAYFLSKI